MPSGMGRSRKALIRFWNSFMPMNAEGGWVLRSITQLNGGDVKHRPANPKESDQAEWDNCRTQTQPHSTTSNPPPARPDRGAPGYYAGIPPYEEASSRMWYCDRTRLPTAKTADPRAGRADG